MKYWQLLDLLLAPSSADSSAAAAALPPALSPLLTQLFKQLSSRLPSGNASDFPAKSYVDLLAVLASPARKLLGLTPNVAETLLDLLGEALTCWSTLALPSSTAGDVWNEAFGVIIEELEEVLPNNLARRKVRLTSHFPCPNLSSRRHKLPLCRDRHRLDMMSNQKLHKLI